MTYGSEKYLSTAFHWFTKGVN